MLGSIVMLVASETCQRKVTEPPPNGRLGDDEVNDNTKGLPVELGGVLGGGVLGGGVVDGGGVLEGGGAELLPLLPELFAAFPLPDETPLSPPLQAVSTMAIIKTIIVFQYDTRIAFSNEFKRAATITGDV
jgi:hypothetical protein